jgi:hypothetical protein
MERKGGVGSRASRWVLEMDGRGQRHGPWSGDFGGSVKRRRKIGKVAAAMRLAAATRLAADQA